MKKVLFYMAIPTYIFLQSGCSIKSNAYKKIHTVFIEEQKTLPSDPVKCTVTHKELQKAYYGKCINGKADGFGRALGERDYEYVGYFKNGSLNGQGFFYIDYEKDLADTYIGNFVDDKREGKGTLYDFSGSSPGYTYGNSYTGNWVDDKMEGFFKCSIGDVVYGRKTKYIEYKDGYPIRTLSVAQYNEEQAEKRAVIRQRELKKQRYTKNTTSNYDDDYDKVLAAGVLGGLAVVFKGVQAFSDAMKNSSSSSSSYTHTSNSSISSEQSSSSSNNSVVKNVKEQKGLKSIKNNGNIGGSPSYLLTCNSGRTIVIKRVKGSWYTGFLGDMGHKFDDWSKSKVGDYLCKH